ncbi:hypothetical protein DFQ28_004398 [Apophysomyces sp. BC1034]|nr:hypothetical protein DFQ28_004398 [Apophysomyces sp. BC1034]
MTQCTSCTAELPNNTKFCKQCGMPAVNTEPNKSDVRCRHCGQALRHNLRFCSQCGIPVVRSLDDLDIMGVESASARPQPDDNVPPQRAEQRLNPASEPVETHPDFVPRIGGTTTRTITRRVLYVIGIVTVAACASSALWWYQTHGRTSTAPAEVSIVAPIQGPATASTAIAVPAPANTATSTTGQPASPNTTAVAQTNAVRVPASGSAPNVPAPASAITTAAPPKPPATAPGPSPITRLLKRAERDLALGRYDKAIATADSVLELEPGNRQAKALVRKAKAKQIDALRNNSSLE